MLRKVLMVICLGVFVFSSVQLFLIYSEYNAMEKEHTQLSNEVVEIKEEPEQKEEIISVDFDSLILKYPDVIGWIYSEDTVINYPVVQGEDNEKYVRTNLDGKYSRAGTLFADYRCKDDVILIYGHHMLDGSMFASILEYQNQKYYDEHPEMLYLTPNTSYRVEILMGFVTNAYDELYDLESLDWLDKKESDFVSNSKYEGEKLLILSTCYKQTGDERYILVGKMMEIEK